MTKHDSFSQWLDNQLLSAGISGKELAAKVGVSEATISRVRNGRTPLSPRMKARLSLALNAKLTDIPNIERPQVATTTALNLWLIQHSIPDHAAINYAHSQGLFAEHGIHAEEISDRDLGARYPQGYCAAIKEQLKLGRSVLAMASEIEIERGGLSPVGKIFSHSYRGYHLITRASTEVPSVDDMPMHQRIFTLKLLLEQLENANIWRNDFDRFSWKSSIEMDFLKALQGLSAELIGITDHEAAPASESKISNKAGLDSLHAFGSQGADFVVGDATALTEAYSHPSQFKVLLSWDKLLKTINTLSEDTPPALMATLKKIYRADRSSVAVERFKAHWTERLSQLEVPVYWQLFAPTSAQAFAHQPMLDRLENVLQDLQQELATPHLRESALQQIKQYCDERTYHTSGSTTKDSFRLAWESCYSGL